MALQRRHQCVADLVVRHHLLFLIGENGVFLLITGDHHFNAFFQIGFVYDGAAVADCAKRCLVDDVGKLCAGCTGSHAGDGVQIHIIGCFDLFGVDFQNCLTACKVRQLHRHTAVKTAGAGQRRVKGFRPVGGRQNDHAGIALKAVHLGQKLVQGLLALIVAAHTAAVSLLANGIDLINKNNARGFFLCLFEQITNLGCAHAHEHFHKFRAGNGEKRHICLACNGFCQHGFARARRAHQQQALRHGSPGFGIFLRVMQVIYDL